MSMFVIAGVSDPTAYTLVGAAADNVPAGLALRDGEVASMASNEIIEVQDMLCHECFEPFRFAVSMAWHSLDVNNFDPSFLDSSAIMQAARPREAPAICTTGALVSPSRMRARLQRGDSTNHVWEALVQERKESFDNPDGKANSDERWAGRGQVIAGFLRQVMQARDDPLTLLAAPLTQHREELCRNNLSRSAPTSENEEIHGCSRILRGDAPHPVAAGAKAPPIHHLRAIQLEWATHQKALPTSLRLDDGTCRVLFFYCPWMPHCRRQLRLLLQMQQQAQCAERQPDWELVTIAIRPSREQLTLYPDLRTLAASAEQGGLRFSVEGAAAPPPRAPSSPKTSRPHCKTASTARQASAGGRRREPLASDAETTETEGKAPPARGGSHPQLAQAPSKTISNTAAAIAAFAEAVARCSRLATSLCVLAAPASPHPCACHSFAVKLSLGSLTSAAEL